ncbi:hypothetical protein MKX08_001055 [Trichoderma sp. CBMAI-0020]|nr:hypothetical protein MKX08_001055 [Trichoderma sp. CBMAI-0020]
MIAFSGDSGLLAVEPIDAFQQVWIWDLISRTVIYKFSEDNIGFGSVFLSPDGRCAVFNGFFDYTKIWDISAKSPESMETTEGKVDISVRVSFSRDGEWLALVSEDKSEIVLLEKTGICESCLTTDTNVESITFSEDGTKLAFGASDGNFGVTDLPFNNTSWRMWKSDTDAPVTSLQFSRDDSLLAVVQTSSMRFFNIETGQCYKVEVPEQPGYGERPPRICAVKFYDNQLAVSILHNGNIHLWNTITGVCVKEISTARPRIMLGMFSAAIDIRLFQGSLQIITTSDAEESAVRIIDVDTEKRIRTFKHGISTVLEFRQDNNTIIHSDRGTINLDQFDLSLDQITAQEESVVYQGYGKHGSWVMKDGQPIIWIPPEYQGQNEQCAISKSQIAIACYSGHLLLIGFLEENMTF